jgi:FMN phosphatase YigB (HAD superfamily)
VCLNEFKSEDWKVFEGMTAKLVIVNLLRMPKLVAEFIEMFISLFRKGTRIVLITDKNSLTQTLVEKYGVHKFFNIYHSLDAAFANEDLD